MMLKVNIAQVVTNYSSTKKDRHYDVLTSGTINGEYFQYKSDFDAWHSDLVNVDGQLATEIDDYIAENALAENSNEAYGIYNGDSDGPRKGEVTDNINKTLIFWSLKAKKDTYLIHAGELAGLLNLTQAEVLDRFDRNHRQTDLPADHDLNTVDWESFKKQMHEELEMCEQEIPGTDEE